MAERRSVVQGELWLSYLEAGPSDGPVVLLLHGLLSDATTWDRVLEPLAARGIRVIALDLIGHGRSSTPSFGYGLVDFAASVSVFLESVGAGPVVVGGHSLGGAIAMQFAHHYPSQVSGLVLVCAGGLGRQVHPVLRGAAVPGARAVLTATVNARTAALWRLPLLHRIFRVSEESVTNLTRMGRSILTPEGRYAFIETLRSVIEPGGQRGSMIEMDMLSRTLPTVIVWSEHDPVIPVSHARATHEHLPGSRLELFPGISHEPHRRHPERFARVVAGLLTTS
jgi:pimeloyl-ACP methyl ester carboxylesterase